jgi:hypothetical protein
MAGYGVWRYREKRYGGLDAFTYLAGTAVGTATATGFLQERAYFEGTATGSASATGALLTGIPLVGSLTARAHTFAQNALPPFSAWTFSGGAYIDGNELVLPNSWDYAESPLVNATPIRFPGTSTGAYWFLGREQWTLAPAGSNNGPRFNTYYYAENGLTAAYSNGGWTSNGSVSAQSVDSWLRTVWSNPGGTNVYWIKVRITNDPTFGTGVRRARNLNLMWGKPGADLALTTFLPYSPESATLAAQLATNITLAGSVSGTATVGGSRSLQTAIQLAGQLTGAAFTSAVLDTQLTLQGNISATSSIQGSLLTAIRLAGLLTGTATLIGSMDDLGIASAWGGLAGPRSSARVQPGSGLRTVRGSRPRSLE